MVEILPVKLLTNEDGQIFGKTALDLGKLARADLPVGLTIVVTAPQLKLKTVLEHFDFGHKDIFEQSLILVKKEIRSIPVPQILTLECGNHNLFLIDGKVVKKVKDVWVTLLDLWIDEIKKRLWSNGFYKGLTEDLEPQLVTFIKKIEAFGSAYFDPLQDDTVIKVDSGKLHPNDFKKLDQIVILANKKLFFPNEYSWIFDKEVKIVNLKQSSSQINVVSKTDFKSNTFEKKETKTTVKTFLDISQGPIFEKEVDGIYISSEKIFDLNKPRDSFEDMLLILMDAAKTFIDKPILFKLADKSEGMGQVRGTLRLLHQESLFHPMVDALDFARHKKGFTNVHIVVPFTRTVNEFLQIKRELAVKKLSRKNSLQFWMEVCTPENIINLKDYLVTGLDGVALNLDELIAYLNGFDPDHEELTFYKNEVGGLIKFIEDGLKLLHQSKIPFIAVGSLILNSHILEFLIEKGIFGVVIEKYEAYSIKDLLHQMERRIILRRS